DPVICDERSLLNAHLSLQGIQILSGDYHGVLHVNAERDDFVFLDPPYHPEDLDNDDYLYSQFRFGVRDQINLRIEFERLLSIGCKVVMTNSNTGFIRDLYHGFDQIVVDSCRRINSKTSSRKGEDLIIVPRKR
ncbi:MAG: DNA adenine methylase, partial [bacterium]|nr:DNA adenine methylase [bacterium]